MSSKKEKVISIVAFTIVAKNKICATSQIFLDPVVYLCIIFVSMHSSFALPG